MIIGLTFRAVTKNSRRRGHIEPFFRRDMLVAMDTDESAIVLIFEGNASCPVRLVTDHQIERRQAVVLLRTRQHVDGMVGGEDNCHLSGVGLRDLSGKLFGIRRRRECKIMYI